MKSNSVSLIVAFVSVLCLLWFAASDMKTEGSVALVIALVAIIHAERRS